MARTWNHGRVAARTEKGAATWKESLLAAYETEYALTVRSSSCAPCSPPKELKTEVHTKAPHGCLRSFTHNRQTLDVTRMLFRS